MRQTILIASCSFDSGVVGPVAQELAAQGYDVIMYEADKVAAGRHALSIRVTPAGSMIRYKNRELDPATIAAAWYRRPNQHQASNRQNPAHYLSMAIEYKGLQDFIWNSIPQRAWLNSPWAMQAANDKLTQLAVARSLGFVIPETRVSNAWSDIASIPAAALTFKAVKGEVHGRRETKVLYSTTLQNPAGLPTRSSPYPGIWQPHLPKRKEWRITVVGRKVFAAAIYTHDEAAKNDWREHQFKPGVIDFRAEPLPQELRAKCIAYLRHWNLRFGAFDFIETPQGEIFFLELNPNGQYNWLEYDLGLPISAAIASELAGIAARANTGRRGRRRTG